jgi:hypothetical protein
MYFQATLAHVKIDQNRLNLGKQTKSRLNRLKNQLNEKILWLRPIFGAFLDKQNNFLVGILNII